MYSPSAHSQEEIRASFIRPGTEAGLGATDGGCGAGGAGAGAAGGADAGAAGCGGGAGASGGGGGVRQPEAASASAHTGRGARAPRKICIFISVEPKNPSWL